MNTQLFLAVLLGVCVGACFAVAICLMVMQRPQQALYPLGHVTEGKSYFFRLPLDESEQDCTPEQIVQLARNELLDAGVPDDVLGRVRVSVSGMMLAVAGEPEDVTATEQTHKLWLRQA
jgi:hypothetical protein